MENFNLIKYNENQKLLYTLPLLIKAIIVNRPSKTIKSPYVADIQLIDDIDGEEQHHQVVYQAHSPSLGTSGLTDKGCYVYVIKNEGNKVKTDYTIYLSIYEEIEKGLTTNICTYPKIAEKLVEKALNSGLYEDLPIKRLEREKCFLNSRFDFCGILEDDTEFILEVKCVPIANYENIDLKTYQKNNKQQKYIDYDFNSKIAYFPEGYRKSKNVSMSPRACKHLQELTQIKLENPLKRCILIFVIQRIDFEYFTINKEDPIYYEFIQNALEQGVEIKFLVMNWINNKGYVFNISPEFIL